MTKRTQRQSTIPLENRYARKALDKRPENNKQETIVPSDTAKALIEVGSNMTNQQIDQDMLAMLKQINEQLKQMQSPSNDCQQKQGQQSTNPHQSLPPEAMASEELQKLFSQLLKNQEGQQNQSEEQIQSQNIEPNQFNKEQQGQSSGKKSKNGAIAVQTAAQVLAEAQYELANELDVSLKKLKQVISESEKIADKISNLLGQGNTTNK